jgi:hypothetical protein
MTITLKSNPDGVSGAIQVNGVDKITVGASGITPESLAQKLTLGTPVTGISGSTILFTGVPSWATKITLMLYGVSFAAAGNAVVQIGAGSLSTTGYTTTVTGIPNGTTPSTSNITNGIGFLATTGASTQVTATFTVYKLTGNTWVSEFAYVRPEDLIFGAGSGYITLGGTLDRVALVATASTFDAGSVNILYE